MNWLDVLLALILLASTAGGLVKGFARVGVGLIAAIAAIVMGLWFYGVAASFVSPYLTSPMASNMIGFFVVFFLVLLAGALAARLLALIFKWTGLTWLDRLLGGAFGVVRGVLVGAAVVMLLMSFSRDHPPRAVVDSELAPYVIDAAGVVAAVAPRELKDGFNASYERVKKLWAETLDQRPRRLPSAEL